MKCEKCGIDIFEGNLCDNCKNVVDTAPVIENNVVTQVPQDYDPVAELMNEPVVGTVNLEKSEVENAIPLGDNNSIPEMPINENVVSVAPEVINEVPVVETPQVTNEQPVTEVQTETVPVQENNVQVQNGVVPENKKNNTPLVIGIIVGAFVLLGGIAFFLPRYLAVSQMFDAASISNFVVEVQVRMDAVSTRFMTEAMQPENMGKSLVFSNDDTIADGIDLEVEEEKMTYKIDINRNGEFTSLIVFDDDFCYQAHDESRRLDKTAIVLNEVFARSKADNLNDGCHGEKVN